MPEYKIAETCIKFPFEAYPEQMEFMKKIILALDMVFTF